VTAEGLRAGSISATMLARVCILAAGLVTGIASARTLGPEGRGQYFAVTTAAAIIAQAANLGLTSSNVFLGARDHARIRPLLLNSTALAVGLGLLGACVVAVWGTQAGRFLGVPRVMLWAICAIGAATLLWSLATSLLIAAERFAALNVWQVASALTAVIAILLCAALHGSAAQFALASALTASVTAAGLFLFIAAGAPGPMRFSLELVRLGVEFSARAYLALLLGYLLQRCGASQLIAISTPGELGQYSIASQVFDVLLIVPGSVSLVLYPMLVRHTDDLWHHVRRTAIVTTGCMLVLCIAAALAAPFVLPLVFGARYTGSTPALWGLLPTVIAFSIVSVLSQYLAARSFPWSIVGAWAAGLGAALVSGIPLTRSYGAIGAGVSQSCGAVLVCALVLAIAWRRTDGLRGVRR
jgi:O-antigen/teichoic acid export membrane protein